MKEPHRGEPRGSKGLGACHLHRSIPAALVGLVQIACGPGISLDPSFQPSPQSDADPDARPDTSVTDVNSEGDAGTQGDASPEFDSDLSDEAYDAKDSNHSDEPDGRDTSPSEPDAHDSTTDAGGGSLDAQPDVSVDAGGGSLDAQPDVSVPGMPDSGDGSPDANLDVAGDARDAQQDDGESRDACEAGCNGPLADYYVDAAASLGGDGTIEKPFKTITAAVKAHTTAGARARVARVAAGTYDAALGEEFPLVLRGLSLEGAASDKTIIVGAGELDHAESGGAFNGAYHVTVVLGDALLATRLSDLTIRSATPTPVSAYHGVFCDRGSASGAVQAPAGQTILNRITVGTGYHIAVMASTSTNPSFTGCNLRMTGSTLTGGWVGLYAIGCGVGVGNVPVMVQVGDDDPTSGNTISSMRAQDENAYAVVLQGCVTRGYFQYNRIFDNSIGIALDQSANAPAPRHTFLFKNNIFERMTAFGLSITGPPVYLEELSNNSFLGISRGTLGASPSYGLAVGTVIRAQVRNNRFIGNDVGVLLGMEGISETLADVGTAGDPGNNVFRCNSGGAGGGGDFIVNEYSTEPDLSYSIPVRVAGNAWDHSPPMIARTEFHPEGSDIVLLNAPNLTADFSNSNVATTPCPSGRSPGPPPASGDASP